MIFTRTRLACSIAVAAALMTGSAFGALDVTKSTIGMDADGTLLNPSGIEATSKVEGSTATVNITADKVNGAAYGVFANMAHETSDNTDVYPTSLNIIVSDSQFTTTTSTNAGGAVTLWNSAEWNGGQGLSHQVVNTAFTGSTATAMGGALAIMRYGNTNQKAGSVAVSASTFDHNTSGTTGGAIYVEGTTLSVNNGTQFSNNHAESYGGAIYVYGVETGLTVNGATFTSNSSGKSGGAISLWSDGKVGGDQQFEINNAVFDNNSATSKGGAIAWLQTEYTAKDGQQLSITNSTFTHNSAANGGALYAEDAVALSGNVSFEHNTASADGGAIYVKGGTDNGSTFGGELTLSAGANELIHFADNTANGKLNDIFLSTGSSASFTGQGRIELLSGLAGAGSVTSDAANVYVADVTGYTGKLEITGGVFAVEAGDYLDSEKYLFGTGAQVTVAEGGELKLAGVTQTGSIKVTDGTGSLNNEGKISFEDAFLTSEINNGTLTITTNSKFITGSDFGDDSTEIQANLANLFARGATPRESDILEQISNKFVAEGDTADTAALSAEGVEAFRQATGGSATAGAFNVAYDAQTQFTDSIIRHQLGEHNGYGVWADVYYTSNEAKTLYGNSGYKTDIYGGVVGFDATFSCGATAGIAVTVGTGDTDTVGALKSSLDTDFYGVSLYTSKDFSGFDAKLDVGYMSFDNDFAGLGDAADVDAWTAGLRGDFKAYEGSVMSITPHVGLRYTHFKSDAVAFNGETSLDVFEAPIGVAFNGNFETNGWKIVPALDFSIVPQLGDTDVDTFAGTVDVIDNLYNTTLGVAATYQNLTFGLDYRYGFGNADRSNNSVNLKVRYRF